MKIQNYQSYQNNQPRFKANKLVTLEALGDVIGKVPDIYKVVADVADNGAKPEDIVRVSRGYFAPDYERTVFGNVIKEIRDGIKNVKNISASKLGEKLAEIDYVSEVVSRNENTIVVNSL